MAISKEQFDEFAKSQINPLTNQPWKSGQEMLDTIKEKVSNPQTKAAFADMFNTTIQNLTLLVIRQSLESSDSPTAAQKDLLNRITNKKLHENGEKLIKKLMTGHTTFEDSKYIPDSRTKKLVESHDIVFYDRDATTNAIKLSDGAYQFKKETDIRPIDWTPHLLNGTLNKYISELSSELIDAYALYKFNALATQITNKANYRVKVDGVGQDVYEIQNELIAIVRQMLMKKSSFNRNKNSKFLNHSLIEDILIVVPSKFEQLRITGVFPQLFNPNDLNGATFKLSPSNFICLENKITINTQNDLVEDAGVEWVDDNTIFILDKSELRHFLMFEKTASQFFASNVLEYIVLHVWGKIDVSPWFKGVIYSNANLLKLPGGSIINPVFQKNTDNPLARSKRENKKEENKKQENKKEE